MLRPSRLNALPPSLSLRLSALALVAALGCAPQPAAPVTVMAMGLGSNGGYQPQRVELRTIENLTALSGLVTHLKGGANIYVDSNDPLLQANTTYSDSQLEKIFVKNAGQVPRANFVQSGGVYWPADFHSWNMTTTYLNFERAFEYFQAMGVPAEQIAGDAKPWTYYFPTFVLKDSSADPIVDNALFFSPIRGFAVLPFETFQKVPLAMNPGVIAHEYGHWVFNQRVYAGKAYPDPFIYWLNAQAHMQVNWLKAMDEGLADYHAYGASCSTDFGCNSRFIASSISDAAAEQRDFAKTNWCLGDNLNTALTTLTTQQFTQKGYEYVLGTVLISAIHRAAGGNAGKREALQRAILAAYSDNNPLTPGLEQLIGTYQLQPQLFTLGAALNTVLTHLTDAELQRDLCSRFMDNLHVPREQMPACPPSAASTSQCPPLTSG